MFAKLLLIVLTMALTAAVLLGIRHQRLNLAHEAARIHRRIDEHEMALWTMQAEIARRCRPDAVRLALPSLAGDWVPIRPGPAGGPPTEVRVADEGTEQTATGRLGG